MNDKLAIAQRIAGARDAADITVEDAARQLGISVETYMAYENGTKDVPLGDIPQLAAIFGADPFAIFTGVNSHAKLFSVTRAGKGPIVERNSAYHYESLNSTFSGAKFMPYFVTVTPDPDAVIHKNAHPGNEFDLVVSGRLELVIESHSIILNEGDSIYFDSSRPHGMRAVGDQPTKFLAVITAE